MSGFNNSTPMNYLGVAKQEIKQPCEDHVKDGWVRITRDSSGNIFQKFGKMEENQCLKYLEEMDDIRNAKTLLRRHEKYQEEDRILYYTDYKNSWDKEEVDDTLYSSDDEEEDDEEDIMSENDNLFDADY